MPTNKPFVPPGGFQGFAQQTPAVHALLNSGGTGARGRATKKRSTKKKTATRKRPTAKRAAKARSTNGRKVLKRMVKGSPAAKRHMAKLRNMRK